MPARRTRPRSRSKPKPPDLKKILAVLQQAIDTEEGNYSWPHDPKSPDDVDTEPTWMYEARQILANS